ncbi:hypothetical protein [Nocardioides litoris]|uniref:hypothetical protein n=1 Tax=Nocardioides litoris TaxID=1926648 RepID=UPI00111DA3AF|nr:hypothetical protein [Nocardioides litoris]
MTARSRARLAGALAWAVVVGLLSVGVVPTALAADAATPQPVTLDELDAAAGGPFVAGTTRTPPVTTAAPSSARFTSTPATVCEPTADGKRVRLNTVGSCSVTVTVPGTGGNTEGTATRAYDVVRAARTIEVAAPTTAAVVGGTWTPVVTATTGAIGTDAVTLVPTDPAACSVSGTTVTYLKARLCTVTATVAEGPVFVRATDDVGVTPGLKAQTVTMTAPTGAVVGVPATPAVTSDSGGTATYATSTPGVCRPTTGGAAIELRATGSCTATATVAGVAEESASGTSAAVTFTVAARTVALAVTLSDPHRFRDTVTVTVTATDTSGGTAPAAKVAGAGTILLGDERATPGTSGPEDVTWVDGVATRTISSAAAGRLAVTATITPTPTSAYTTTTSTTEVTIDDLPQTVAFGTPPRAVIDGTWTAAATVTPATEADGTARKPVLTSLTPATCTVATGTTTVTYVAAGPCRLQAAHPGGGGYAAAVPATLEVTVHKLTRALAWGTGAQAPPTTAYAGETWTPTVVTDAAAGPVVYTTSDTAVCTATGSTVAFVGQGACTVTATMAGTDRYDTVSVQTGPIAVALRPVTVTVSPATTSTVYGASLALTVRVRDDRATVRLLDGTGTLSAPGILATPRTLTFTDGVATTTLTSLPVVPTTTLTAHFVPTTAEQRVYEEDEGTATVTVTPAPQTITTDPTDPGSGSVGDVLELHATGGGSGNPVTGSVPGGAPCSVAAPVAGQPVRVTLERAGTCTVTLRQAGNGNFLDATPVTVPLSSARRPVKVVVSTAPSPFFWNEQVVVRVAVVDDSPGRERGTPAPGTVTLSLPDAPAPVLASNDEAGTATATYTVAAAGTQRVVVTYRPTNPQKYDAITPPEPASEQSVTAQPAPQTLLFDDTTKPATAWATRTFEPEFTGTGTGALTLTARPGPDQAVHCSVRGAAVRFDTPGTCVVDARREAVTGQQAASPVRTITFSVQALPLRLRLVTPTSATVGRATLVSATARDTVFAGLVPGSGHLAVDRLVRGTGADPGDWERVTPAAGSDDEADTTWTGSTRSLAFEPTRAGTYRVVPTFTASPAAAYAVQAPSSDGRFTVAPAPQVVSAVDPPATAAVLDTWSVRAVGGGSSAPVLATVATGSVDVCSVGGPDAAQVITFDHDGACTFTLRQGADADHDASPPSDPVTVTVAGTTSQVSLAAQTVAQPVVGEEHLISVRSTTASGRPVPGRFTLTTDSGITISVPEDEAGAPVTSADFALVPDRTGTLPTRVAFVPTLPADEVAGSSLTRTLSVLPGTQRVTLAPAPPSDASYVGDTWDPAPGLVGGPSGARPVLAVTADTSPARCAVGSDGKVRLLRPGTCTVTVNAPASPGGDWKAADEVSREFQVALRPTALTLVGPDRVDVREPFTIRVESSGAGTGSTPGTTTPVAVTGTVRLTLARVGDAPADAVTWPVTVTSMLTTVTAQADLAGEYVLSGTFTPSSDQYEPSAARNLRLSVDKRRQTLDAAPVTPAQLPVGSRWTPALTSSAGLDAAVASTTPSICTVSATGTVTTLVSGECHVTFTVAPDHPVYDDVDPVEAVVPVRVRPTTVTLLDPGAGEVGTPQVLTATVTAPPVAAVPRTVDQAPPLSGTVTFTATAQPTTGGASQTSTTVAAERFTMPAGATSLPVTTTWRPPGSTTGVTRTLRAAVTIDPVADPVPAGTDPCGPDAGPRVWSCSTSPARTLVVAKGDPALVLSVSGTASGEVTLTASLPLPSGYATTPGTLGTVTFKAREYGYAGEDVPEETAVVGDRLVATRTVLDFRPEQRLTLTATYSGTTDLAATATTTVRDAPQATVGGAAPTEWQRGPVSFPLTCTETTAHLVTPCPASVVVSGDGAQQSGSVRVLAEDGGAVTVRTPTVRIDATPPVLVVQGVAQGAVYAGPSRSPLCVATDATSGLASCTVQTTRVDRVTRRATVRAVDVAGNVATRTVTYRELQEYVVGAARDSAGRFVVRPGQRLRVETITTGARRRPQLVVRSPGKPWRSVATMVPLRLRDGQYTWYALYRLPARWRPSTEVGVRTGSTVQRVGLVRG